MLAGQKVMQEFLAIGSTSRVVDPIVTAMNRLMSDPLELARQKAALKDLSQRYAQPGASQRAARAICDQLGWNTSNQSLRQAG
jgi:lipid A disaccharide synthetase